MFRKTLIALAAMATVASPLMAGDALAQPGRHDRDRHAPPMRHNDHHNWSKGQRFDSRYADHYQVINNYRTYRLHAPPRGYHWVRSGNDAVLVALTSGLIASVLANAIH